MVRTVALCALLAGLALAQPYEHVVVTADSMVGAFAPLGDYIENRMGLLGYNSRPAGWRR